MRRRALDRERNSSLDAEPHTGAGSVTMTLLDKVNHAIDTWCGVGLDVKKVQKTAKKELELANRDVIMVSAQEYFDDLDARVDAAMRFDFDEADRLIQVEKRGAALEYLTWINNRINQCKSTKAVAVLRAEVEGDRFLDFARWSLLDDDLDYGFLIKKYRSKLRSALRKIEFAGAKQ
jgi:hypothetical protein